MKRTVLLSFSFAFLLALLATFGMPPILAAAQGPTPVPATNASPGLYVTGLRIQPVQPAFNQSVSFFPTFLNNTQGDYAAKWLVYVWRADQPLKTNNETAAALTHFPVGTAEYAAADDSGFKYGATGRTCEYFFARVAWLDGNNQPVYFTDQSGRTVEKGFSVCDILTIPTAVPGPTSAPTAIPKPGPGLFVTDMRLSPAIPAFFKDATFIPAFTNTADQTLNFKWKVYVWKADDLTKSNNETSFAQTAFAPGAAEVASLGNFSFGATGKTCENFFARVGWADGDNKIQYFMFPDGRIFEKPFSVCDVAVIPTAVPPTAAPPTAIAAPAPGLFVTGLTLSPNDPPMHNQVTTFTAAFSNTSDRELTFPWKVYIYKLDDLSKSNNETSLQTTSFASGIKGGYTSLGSFKFGATGYSCDAFSARVGWLDADNKITFFMQPDGRVFEKPFSVCN